MAISRRTFIKNSLAVTATLALYESTQTGAGAAVGSEAAFQPNWSSLAQYQCPEWFRDAKFGIWAHWTAQCVPEQGDWYARHMYEEGSPDYKYHCATYGHPSKVGFKDIDHIWKAENWDPEKHIAMYKAAGAKYFCAIAQHHDNFDCFDSKYQPWNSVAIGPKKDIIGTWAKAARKAGLKFGVTSHGSHAWSWYQTSQGADKTGPLAGVPYDGNLTKAQGKGQWWEGLDPQALYAQDHPIMGGTISQEWEWNNFGKGELPNAAYCEKFYNRTIDLIDKYHPDLLYFDDDVLPLYPISDVGVRIAAHYYNTNRARTHGQVDGVLTGKNLNAQQEQCLVRDIERGVSSKIDPIPWQTDTCIGDWMYSRAIYENHSYKTPDQVIKMLVDIVSKNGNLLLNIPMKGDGTFDPDEIKFLEDMALWMPINGEAIFETRPWKISGEGPTKPRGGSFNEHALPYTSQDFRFTTKGNILYAAAMEWPTDGTLTVTTLAANAPGIVGKAEHVSLLGAAQEVDWVQNDTGLVVTMPAQKPCDHAYVLKIHGINLEASVPVLPASPLVQATASGTLTLLPSTSDPQGDIRKQGGAVPNLGYWDNAGDTVTWNVHFDQPGIYQARVKTSAQDGASLLRLDLGHSSAQAVIPPTASWDTYETVTAGTLAVPEAGNYVLTARAADPLTWKAVNLAWVILQREK